MTDKQTEALKLALEALEDNQHLVADNERHAYVMEYNDLIEKCKEALAQPEQEPVGEIGWAANIPNTIREVNWIELCPPVGTKLYTSPPQRTWVGLTEDEREELMDTYDVASTDYAHALEAKLKEKNT